MKDFLNILFDPGEGVCLGNQFANEVLTFGSDYLPSSPEFFCINPLDISYDHGHFLKDEYSPNISRRADINVTCRRSFLFEMDGLQLSDQLEIFRTSIIPFTSIVYSGGKSYHAILSIEGGLVGEAHTEEASKNYKDIFRRLAARLDKEARSLGHSYPEGHFSFIDHSCKNASRLSRFPGTIRDNGKMQDIVLLTERMPREEFYDLLESCPIVKSSSSEFRDRPEKEIDDLKDFESAISPSLRRKLKFVDWAGDHGMYPTLYRLSLWAIDEANVTKSCFLEYLDKYTFPSLLRRGYPSHKLTIAVDHAFKEKGQS